LNGEILLVFGLWLLVVICFVPCLILEQASKINIIFLQHLFLLLLPSFPLPLLCLDLLQPLFLIDDLLFLCLLLQEGHGWPQCWNTCCCLYPFVHLGPQESFSFPRKGPPLAIEFLLLVSEGLVDILSFLFLRLVDGQLLLETSLTFLQTSGLGSELANCNDLVLEAVVLCKLVARENYFTSETSDLHALAAI